MEEQQDPKKSGPFVRPFKVCFEKGNSYYFTIWSVFTLVGGLLGLIFNIIQRCIFGGYKLCEAIYIDSVSGSFYTFSIVLISAVLAPLFIQFVEEQTTEFRRIKMGFVTVCFFVILFDSVFYSVYTSKFNPYVPQSGIKVDWWQLSFFILSLLIAIYSFGIKLIDDHPEKHTDLRENGIKREIRETVEKAEKIEEMEDVKL